MGETDSKLEAKVTALRALEEIIERLRAPDGCPWDRAQTIAKMAHNILEEACEAVDAIREGRGAPTPALCEELGDLLMNILLTSRIAEDGGAFGIREVAEAILAKLVRRHPHVFRAEHVSSVEDVLRRWNAIKAEEKTGETPSVLGCLPRSLPALSAALKVGERAARVGFDWPDAGGALKKVEEELREVAEAMGIGPPAAGQSREPARIEREVGDLLFAAVNLARKSGVDPEAALRETVDRFRKRFRYIEARTDVATASLEEVEALWNEAKVDDS